MTEKDFDILCDKIEEKVKNNSYKCAVCGKEGKFFNAKENWIFISPFKQVHAECFEKYLKMQEETNGKKTRRK